jgi:hypothetical protein
MPLTADFSGDCSRNPGQFSVLLSSSASSSLHAAKPLCACAYDSGRRVIHKEVRRNNYSLHLSHFNAVKSAESDSHAASVL